jgi:hypothetical protein
MLYDNDLELFVTYIGAVFVCMQDDFWWILGVYSWTRIFGEHYRCRCSLLYIDIICANKAIIISI